MPSGNYAVLMASLAASFAAYAHRIRVEDEMLLQAFGEAYAVYRREVAAVIPFLRAERGDRAKRWRPEHESNVRPAP